MSNHKKSKEQVKTEAKGHKTAADLTRQRELVSEADIFTEVIPYFERVPRGKRVTIQKK